VRVAPAISRSISIYKNLKLDGCSSEQEEFYLLSYLQCLGMLDVSIFIRRVVREY
jgi:hypothetical protein